MKKTELYNSELVINNQTGKLCQNFKSFLYDNLSPEYIPHDFCRNSYWIDRKVLGKYHNCFIFESYLGDEEIYIRNGYRRRPEDLTFEQWISYTDTIRYWIHWISKRVFNPVEMLANKYETDKVYLRIAVSELNKWELPRDFKDYIFDHLIVQYYMRKRVFEIYFYKIILGIPFY